MKKSIYWQSGNIDFQNQLPGENLYLMTPDILLLVGDTSLKELLLLNWPDPLAFGRA